MNVNDAPIAIGLKQVMALTNLRKTKINELRKEQLLRSCKVGSRRLYFRASVEAFLAAAEADGGVSHD